MFQTRHRAKPSPRRCCVLALAFSKRILTIGRHTVHDNRFSRRYFFYGTLLAGAVPTGGFGSSPSLSGMGYKSPNEKLNVAGVGVGVRGPAILVGCAATEHIVALCDVDEEVYSHGFSQNPNANK